MDWRVVYQTWWHENGEFRVRGNNINVLYAGEYSQALKAFRDALKITFGHEDVHEVPSHYVDGNRSYEQHQQNESREGWRTHHIVISLEPSEFDGNPLGI